MNSLRLLVRQQLRLTRQYHKCNVYCQEAAAVKATAAKEPLIQIPVPEGQDKPVSPKIDKLFNDIAALNLLEVAELSDVLKKRLNLPDIAAAPVGFAAAPKEEEEDAAPTQVQTSFTLKLVKFDEKQKVALIKEIKNLIPGANLVQAKKFVEGVPAIVKSDISKDEAEKLKETIVKVGGEVEIV